MSDLINALYMQQYAQQLAQAEQSPRVYRNYWGMGYPHLLNYAEYQKIHREAFYRSCSQNWLNAMLDVELGL